MKAYNHSTGAWFVIGKGFVTECMWKASKLTEEQMLALEQQYNPYVKRVNEAYDDCGCNKCCAEGDEE